MRGTVIAENAQTLITIKIAGAVTAGPRFCARGNALRYFFTCILMELSVALP